MKFFHLSDLHIGKQLHYYNLAEDQRVILQEIIEQARVHRPDAILLCGDIFDKAIPSGEAYTLFDEFLNDLAGLEPKIPVLAIAGNHDSPQRLAYARSFLERQKIYLSVMPPQEQSEHLRKVVLEDSCGSVNFYLLPFLKPGYVRGLFPQEELGSYHQAVEKLLNREKIDWNQRNVLLSHQFYVSGSQQPELCDSEQTVIQVGGLDSVDASLLEPFDYAALGHIHGPQQVMCPHIRYSGTPLKYSVSEEHHNKAITLVTLKEKGTPAEIQSIPLHPLRQVRREQGLLQEILERATPDNCQDYISVTITDEKEPYQPLDLLKEKYHHILELRVDNQRTRSMRDPEDLPEEQLSPMEVFAGFYQELQGQPMGPKEQEWMNGIFRELGMDGRGNDQ